MTNQQDQMCKKKKKKRVGLGKYNPKKAFTQTCNTFTQTRNKLIT